MRLKMLLWVIVFFVLPVAIMAQDNKEVLIHEMYDKSGMEKQIAQLPMIVQVGFDQAVASDNRLKVLPRSVIREIRASIETAFAPESIKKTILGKCREKLSIDELKKILRWLNSPIGRKFTQLEEAASTPEKYVEMQRFAAQLQESPPSSERLKVIEKLDSALKVTESTVEVAINTQYAIAIAIVASQPKEQQPAYDKLFEAVEQNRSQIEAAMRSQTIVSFLYTYSSLTDAELDRFIAFATSPAGTNYHIASISGLKKALLDGGYKWGESIAGIVNKSASKTEI